MASISYLLALLACLIAFAQSQERCEYCEGKVCGPNGIGGSCGDCAVGERCSRGVCVCNRDCTARQCGTDPFCGTSCGECLPGQTCQNSICVGDCTPQCTRDDLQPKVCGWDRCGGNCGSCPDNFRCKHGQCLCYPECENKHCGDDGCGGSCGTCEGDAICQGPGDENPGLCYFDCFIEILIEVRELPTDLLVAGECSIDVTGPNGFVFNDLIYPGSNPGQVALDATQGKLGTYTFVTTCAGYEISTESHEVTGSGQLITLYVDFLTITIEVRDELTDELLPSASISISGVTITYSLQVSWISPSYTWSHGGFATYSFTTSSAGYTTRTESREVTTETRVLILYLGKGSIPIRVEECLTSDPVSTATITVAGETINYVPGSTSFTPNNGFVSYTFSTSSPNYLDNTQTVAVTVDTQEIVLCVNYRPIPFTVTDCETGALIDGASVTATSSVYVEYSLTFTHVSAGTVWTPVGYSGTYTFVATAELYNSGTFSTAVSASTESLTMCLPRSAFCGDGVCNGAETGSPTSADRCGDCGRIRGIISLAVGQKDQLQNITVSVWADPVNPGLLLTQGTSINNLPAPVFTVQSDSKGSFSAGRLSFDAPIDSRTFGSYSRRFYFSLTGTFVDRTSGQDTTITLLPLWWNYELTNLQYVSGSTIGTNNSPSLYFYMTPPFTTNDALVRTILSWGTLIEQTATSIPDIDLVIAGPADQTTIATFGSGVVNFENKDLHASTNLLPYAKIITDSAQGFGPEVVDFYGTGANNLDIGFSDTYAPDAPANVYEIWVDKPNSSPNEELILTTISQTNAFLVFYINDGAGRNEQQFFIQRTGVEHAYGFYNGDQWNQIDSQATLWHVVDITEDGVDFEGFPSEGAGAKYGFDAGFFETQKSLPCGHTSARGASPAYCPATLTYPQSKKK